MKTRILIAALAAATLWCGPVMAQNAQVVSACGTPTLTYPVNAFRPLTVDTTGKLCDSSSGGGSLSAKATAAAPSYVEGSTNPLSMDLSGNTRITGTVAANQGTANATPWNVSVT